MAGVIATFRTFGGILVVCPCCQHVMRLSDLTLRYAGEFEHTVLDPIRQEERCLGERQDRIRLRRKRLDRWEKALRQRARARAAAKARQIVEAIDPAVSALGYDPQDIRVVSHPVDLVVFDGLGGDKVRRVVFIARPRDGGAGRLQRSVGEAIDSGRCGWETVRIASDGAIKVTRT